MRDKESETVPCADCRTEIVHGVRDDGDFVCASCSFERDPGICRAPSVSCTVCGHPTEYRERGMRNRVCTHCLEVFVSPEDDGRGFGHAPIPPAQIEAHARHLAEAAESVFPEADEEDSDQ